MGETLPSFLFDPHSTGNQDICMHKSLDEYPATFYRVDCLEHLKNKVYKGFLDHFYSDLFFNLILADNQNWNSILGV